MSDEICEICFTSSFEPTPTGEICGYCAVSNALAEAVARAERAERKCEYVTDQLVQRDNELDEVQAMYTNCLELIDAMRTKHDANMLRAANAESALALCGIAGIADTFASPADAIWQMARYIKEIEPRLNEVEKCATTAEATLSENQSLDMQLSAQIAFLNSELSDSKRDAEFAADAHEQAMDDLERALLRANVAEATLEAVRVALGEECNITIDGWPNYKFCSECRRPDHQIHSVSCTRGRAFAALKAGGG